jgi:limonene-1,2-epoxide hydrolase
MALSQVNSHLDGKDFFIKTNRSTMENVFEFYEPQAILVDPLGTHHGVEKIKAYYERLYENAIEVKFDFSEDIHAPSKQVLCWTMTMRHPSVGGGKPILVEGCSVIFFSESGRAHYHRDYFDAGDMLFDPLPVIGWLTRSIKRFARGNQ